MRISIAGFSFHGLLSEGQMSLFGYLESVKYRYHLHTADIWNGMLASEDDDYVALVRRALDERELTCANYHADGVHVWDDDPEVRAAHREGALRHLRIAEKLGARTVRIDTGGVVGPITAEQLEVLSATFREYAEFGADAGFACGPETHWGLSLVVDNMEAIARSVDHPCYGVLLHIGHFELGDEEEGDRRLAPWAVHTHVDQRTTETRLESAMAILRDAGYRGYWGVEHHSGRNEYREVERQLASVRRVLASWGPAGEAPAPEGPLNRLLPHLD